jgi:hypothetical protein
MFDCLTEPLQEIFSRQATSETNPKSEYRNPKQTPRQKNLKSENENTNPNEACLGFYLFWSFEIVSNFRFRASNFCWWCALRSFGVAQDMLCAIISFPTL